MQQRVFEAVAAAGSDLQDQLRAGLFAYFRYFADRPQRFELLYGPGERAANSLNKPESFGS